MGLWIGRPGRLHQIRDGATSFERAPDLGVTEFRALSGAVTTWAPPVYPRRLRLTWGSMARPDFEALDRLARRLDGPGPVVVLDPLAGSLLEGEQSLGVGSTASWSVTGGGAVLGGAAGMNALVRAEAGTELSWEHPTWSGWPVCPDLPLTWWAPQLVDKGAQCRLLWRDREGVGRWVSAGPPGIPLVTHAPADAYFATPLVRIESAGIYVVGPAALSVGTAAPPVPAVGDGCPPYSVTGYTHAAVPGAGEYRNVSLDLVEVASGTR
ncbi:hypothetical protein [Streptomyces buecherae]|uniref:hypothetical protein n=1 Tax=Streptomyces buecherae TaxID=2763006 RepID=UPI001C257C69|nr:hypothetical protein [Streptomyces buecherae]